MVRVQRLIVLLGTLTRWETEEDSNAAGETIRRCHLSVERATNSCQERRGPTEVTDDNSERRTVMYDHHRPDV